MQWQIYRYIETNAHIDTKGRWTPHLKLSMPGSQLLAKQCLKWEPIWNCHNSFTLYPALSLVIWCWATGQVSHTFIYYFRKWTNFCQFPVVVVVLLIAYCCCCVLHNNNKQNYKNNENENEKIHINWSFCSDYEVFAK